MGRTYEQEAEYNRRAYERDVSYRRSAKDVPCADCGARYPHYVMEFDHREGEVKVRCVANLRAKKLREELAKCDVVCANCHRVRTWTRKQQRSGKGRPRST